MLDTAPETSQASASVSPEPGQRIGVVAGWGSFPLELAAQLRDAGKSVYVAAIRNHADPGIRQYAVDMNWFGVAKLGAQIRYFQRHRVDAIALAGKIFKHRILHHGWGWIGHLPDLGCVRALHHHFVSRTKDGRDDSLLTAIVDAYQRGGMTVLSVDQCAPNLLAEDGYLTRRRLRRTEWIDIVFGWRIARQMGGLDVGQSVTAKDQIVLGVEAIEGTDALIARTGSLCPRGKFVLVKTAKPNQDMRFDVPTIGPRTIQQMARAGGTAIAIEAGRTIIVDRDETLKAASRAGISVVSVREEGGLLILGDRSSPVAGGDQVAAFDDSHASDRPSSHVNASDRDQIRRAA